MSDLLGFTFYPKDWWTSESYFELNATQRYIYLECIFIMYSNNGIMVMDQKKIENRLRTKIEVEDWEAVTSKFLIEENRYTLLSVNKRLKKAVANRENGKKGGRPPKPKKPNLETQNNPPSESESESKEKIKESNVNDIPISVSIPDLNPELGNKINNKRFSEECKISDQWSETTSMYFHLRPKAIFELIDAYDIHLIIKGAQKTNIDDYKYHFLNWIKKQDLTEYLHAKRTGTNQLQKSKY